MKFYIGIDIGGTKSTVVLANKDGKIFDREQLLTDLEKGWQSVVKMIISIVTEFMKKMKVEAIGISCGGPLDSHQGLILSPPNLPGWDDVPIVEIFRDEFNVPTYLENDANAGALAEWIFGAGKGVQNMIFLTFGTGMGAGLILNGRLYKGTNDLGGEVGHIRLAEDGPIGFHKRGSFEGFCSGPGMAQMMASRLRILAEEGDHSEMLKRYKDPDKVTGKDVVEWALQKDALALQVVEESGIYLGKGLSVLIDILNPEIVVVGSMGVRLGDLLFEPARRVIAREALAPAAKVCRIVPAGLGEEIGDFASLCVAIQANV